MCNAASRRTCGSGPDAGAGTRSTASRARACDRCRVGRDGIPTSRPASRSTSSRSASPRLPLEQLSWFLPWPLTADLQVRTTLRFQERLGIGPLSEFPLKFSGLVDQNLPVVCQDDARPLERTRRRPFEVDAGRPESAAVTRTFELA